MKLNKKSLIYLSGGILGLVLILLLIKNINQAQYRKQIPEPSKLTGVSEAVSQQILEATKVAKKKPSAENLGMLGMVYHSSASYQQAAECYKLATERDPEQWIWFYYLGFLNTEMGQSEGAIENFSRVIELNPEIYHAWYYCGQAHMNLRSYEEAEKYFSRISDTPKVKPGGETTRIDHFPLGSYAKLQLSLIYIDTGKTDLAEQTLLELLETNKLFGPAYRLLGNIYRTRGDTEEGERYILRANDLMAASAPVDALIDRLVLLSKSELFVLKKIDEAIYNVYSDWALTIIDNALQFLPDNRHLIAKAIKTWLWYNLEDKAIAIADDYLAFPENSYSEVFDIGKLFFQKELYPQAIKFFISLEDIRPGVKETWEKLAISFWRLDEKNKAINILDQILGAHPNNMEVLADVTEILIFEFEEEKISSDYLKILKHFLPSDPKVLKMSGYEAEQNGKLREAVSLYESSFSANPEDITTIKRLGDLLIREEMWEKSIRLYSKALEHHANHPLILERLGNLLINCPDERLRAVDQGIVYSERAFMHAASSPDIKIEAGKTLAKVYFEQGDQGRAASMMHATILIAERYNPEKLPELERTAEQYKP